MQTQGTGVAGAPNKIMQGNPLLTYKAQVDQTGDFSLIVKGNLKNITLKIFEMVTSTKCLIVLLWFFDK